MFIVVQTLTKGQVFVRVLLVICFENVDLFLGKVCLKCVPELNSFKSLLSDPNKCYNKTDCHGSKADVKDYIQIGRDSLTFSRFLTLENI